MTIPDPLPPWPTDVLDAPGTITADPGEEPWTRHPDGPETEETP